MRTAVMVAGALCLIGSITVRAADVSVVATVDQNRIAYGESLVYTITINGSTSGTQPVLPTVDGLNFAGPSTQVSTSIVNNQISQSFVLKYQVTPTRTGVFVIPAVEVDVGGQKYHTEPVQITVDKSALDEQLKQSLYGKVRFDLSQVYLGQTAPLEVYLFVRQGVPLRGLTRFQEEADGLGYKYQGKELKQTTQVISGVNFSVIIIDGSISPTRVGRLMFGPSVVTTQVRVEKKGRAGSGSPFDDPFFQPFFQNVEVREVPVTIDAVPIEVLPLPDQGRPVEFGGAVGQWRLEVSAKPTEVSVGDPITLTVRVSGDGNIDTVPVIKLGELEDFKTYDPTIKTTKNELGTQGERTFQQVLIPKNAEVKQLPEIHLAFFDPIARQYRMARQEPIQLVVKSGTGGPTVVGGGLATAPRPREKLGEDIVYLKGDLGPVAGAVPLCATPAFWILNAAPVVSLLAAAGWKRRTDRLRGDVAYARRSRAARQARKLLATASSHDLIQRALQGYLGDRLNISASGITASVVDEQLVPRGLNGELAIRLKACFEECDTARFAGGASATTVNETREKVERLIDELEKKSW